MSAILIDKTQEDLKIKRTCVVFPDKQVQKAGQVTVDGDAYQVETTINFDTFSEEEILRLAADQLAIKYFSKILEETGDIPDELSLGDLPEKKRTTDPVEKLNKSVAKLAKSMGMSVEEVKELIQAGE